MGDLLKLTTLDKLSKFKTECDQIYMTKKQVDDTPIDNSENLVTSGGVKAYVDNADAILQEQITTLQETVNGLTTKENPESETPANVTSDI